MSDIKPFVLDFDLLSGFCKSGKVKPIQRRVSNMVSQFADEAAAKALVEGGDPLLYEFYGLDLPEDDSGVLQFGTTILYPGKVGQEYYMTKGHFHTILDTSEIGDALYVPGRWAHRSINTGDEPLVMFFVYRADAGHDYGTIEEKGYRKLVLEQDGKPVLVDNPKWKQG